MARRVISVWLPRLATDRLDRRRPLAPAEATASVAVAGGVFPGMTLSHARAVLPGLRTFAADPPADARTLAGLAAWCERYTPWAAADGADGIWLDATGCTHLCGGEDAMLADLVRRLDGLGFRARAALADTPGAAWAAARFMAAAGEETVVIAAGARAMRQALRPLPVKALRLDAATADGLERVGLRRIGDLYSLPRAPLAARFGEAPARRLDQALGRLDEPLSPRRPAAPFRARLVFAEPIADGEDIVRATRHLLAELGRGLAAAERGARRLELVLFRTDGTRAEAAIGTSRPLRDAAPLLRLFEDKLAGIDAGFGIEAMVLAATAVDPLPPVQAGLGRAETPAEGIHRLVDRLANRLGAGEVVRLQRYASHIPERACRAVPALDGAPAAPPAPEDMPPLPARPPYLLVSPEPIEAVAPIPDHPPMLFRWRRRTHRVRHATGPERIAPEWWRRAADEGAPGAEDAARLRDYYRVEDESGQRFWLFREGLYRPDRPPRWYLHGFFA